MKVEGVEVMRLTSNSRAQINALFLAAFYDSFADRSLHQQRHHVRLVVHRAATIVGHMAICCRAIRMGNSLATAAGLAAVARRISLHSLGSDKFMQGTVFAAPNTVRFTDMTGAKKARIASDGSHGLMVMAMSDLVWGNTMKIDLPGTKF